MSTPLPESSYLPFWQALVLLVVLMGGGYLLYPSLIDLLYFLEEWLLST